MPSAKSGLINNGDRGEGPSSPQRNGDDGAKEGGKVPAFAQQPSYALQLIRSILDSLPPGESRVAEVVVARPHDVIEWSAVELGRYSGTSAATVIRACRRLGFEGLDELRLALARDLGWRAAEAARVEGKASQILNDVFSAAVATLPSMLRTVNSDDLEKLVEILVNARVVFTVSTGGWAAEGASELAFGLTMIGRSAFFSADQLVQHIAAANLGPGDVCVVVSQSGTTRPNIEAAKVARAAGATVVAFGTHVRSYLEKIVDLSVCLDRVGYFVDPMAAINHVGLILGVRSLVLAVRAKVGAQADLALQDNLNRHAAYHYQADQRLG